MFECHFPNFRLIKQLVRDYRLKDPGIISTILTTIINNPDNLQYRFVMNIMFCHSMILCIIVYCCTMYINLNRSLNLKNLERLFDNHNLSINLLKQFGFQTIKNKIGSRPRLVFKLHHPNIQTEKLQACSKLNVPKNLVPVTSMLMFGVFSAGNLIDQIISINDKNIKTYFQNGLHKLQFDSR